MQPANRPLDALLLKTTASPNPGDVAGKSPTDSNISKNSFNEVLDKERAQSSESASPARSDHDSEASTDQGTTAQAGQTENRDVERDGNDYAQNGKALPADIPVEEVSEELNLIHSIESETEGESPADGDGVAADTDVTGIEQGLIQPQPDKKIADSGKSGTVEQATGLPQTGTVNKAPDGTTPRAATAGKSAIADAAVSGSKVELNTRQPLASEAGEKTRDFQRGLESLKVAQTALSTGGQTEVSESAKQQVRADMAQLSQQISASQKLESAAVRVQVPLNSPDWGQAVAQRVLLMANSGMQAAKMQLHPRELGPVDVRISMVNDQTQIQFSSQYSVVRETLESSLPRLREMFDSSNLQLVDVNVSDQTLAEREQSQEEGQGRRGPGGAERDELDPKLALSELDLRSSALIDYYA